MLNRRIARRALTSLAIVISLSASPELFARCGVERWSVKTGTDADAAQVDLANPKTTTIADLVELPAPHPIPTNNRVAPTETTLWVVNATLTDYKLESGSSGDSDYHLVLDDGQGHTMVAEIPSPDCVDSSSPFSAQIAKARTAFDSKLTASSSFQTANIPVQITGVGMFDFKHGQRGAAPNVIELHPVLEIVFNPSAPVADFTLSLPASVHVTQGGSVSITVTAISTLTGAAPDVTIMPSGLPAGITTHVTPLGGGKATISLEAGNAAPTGTFPFAVTGTANGKSHTQGSSLEVTAAAQPPAGQQWEYQVVTAASDQDMIDKANQLGTDEWDMVGIVRQGTTGWKAFFKRTKRNF